MPYIFRKSAKRGSPSPAKRVQLPAPVGAPRKPALTVIVDMPRDYCLVAIPLARTSAPGLDRFPPLVSEK